MKTFFAIVVSGIMSCEITAGAEPLFESGNSFAPAVKLVATGIPNAIKTKGDEMVAMEAMAYLKGYLDMYSAAHLTGKDDLPFMLPEKATVGQLAKVVDKYFDSNPQFLDKPLPVLLLMSLADAFPNPKSIFQKDKN